MPEFWKDPRTWAPLATSVGIFVSLTLWLINNRRKELSYEILSRTSLVSVAEGLAGKIQILFNDQPVRDVSLILVRIINSGHIPIRSAEFEGRFAIALEPPAEILMAEVCETHPETLEHRSTAGGHEVPLISQVEKNTVMLRPILLNAKDSITVRILASHATEKIMLIGHIEGIHKIKEARENLAVPLIIGNIGAILMFAAAILINPEALFKLHVQEIIPYLASFLVGYVLVLIGFFLPKRGQISARRLLSATFPSAKETS